MIGGYERLNEQPVAQQSNIPFLCLTDDPSLGSQSWRMMRVEPNYPMDPVRSQRLLKLLPHRYLPDFDTTLYIDNSVLLTQPPEAILDRYLHSSPFALPWHSFRKTTLDEFLEVQRLLLDDPDRVFEQLNHYALSDPDVLLEQPYWTGVLMRHHEDGSVRQMLESWAAEVQRYSRRDQLSINLAFKRSVLRPDRIEIDNHQSWFHTWPHSAHRKNRRIQRSESLARLVSQLEGFEGPLRIALEKVIAAQSPGVTPASSLSGMSRFLLNIAKRSLPRLRRRRTGVARRSIPDHVRLPNGRMIYVDPSDERAKQLVQSGGDLNPLTSTIWRLLLGEFTWTHIIDVGANYGELLVNSDLPSCAEVIALEPNPYVLTYLRRTLSELGRPVALLEQAASAQQGTARLVADRTWSGMSTIAGLPAGSENHQVEVIQVPTTTLTAVVGAQATGIPPRVLVKIDVEGNEQAVLEGALALIERAERFAGLVEILHADDRSLNWLITRFALELYDKQTKKLVPSSAINASELRCEIAAKQYYPQDAVLRPRA